MPPSIPWEVAGGILAGLAALITALVAIPKMLAEVRALRRATTEDARRAREQGAATARAVAAIDHELRPNSGGSARDLLDRIEALTQQNATELAALRDDMADIRSTTRRHDHELGRANDTLAQLGVRITSTEERISDQLSDHSTRIHHLETREAHP